jgi:thioredoxin-dependent peroxiredoxin
MTPTTGQAAPDFELLNDEGKPFKLSDLRGKKVVLYFYPEDFTGGCELQACNFRDAYPKIEAKNAVVVGISPDSPERHKEFREALKLPFHLLSDKGAKVADAWGLWEERTNDSGKIWRTTRAHFVIDENGKIVDAQAPVKAPESTPRALEALGA